MVAILMAKSCYMQDLLKVIKASVAKNSFGIFFLTMKESIDCRRLLVMINLGNFFIFLITI